MSTSPGFDETYARQAVAELSEKGIAFSSGLKPSELDAVEEAVGSKLPPELRLLWSVGLPKGDRFPDWRVDAQGEAKHFRDWVEQATRFDVQEGDFWHPGWGPRPADHHEAVERAVLEISTGPPMIRVYAHRFMTSQPTDWGNPVLSVWQLVDSIYYGYDLADYLAKEFKIARPGWSRSSPPRVPFWGDLFDLLSEQGIK